jgi:hypothetical protein
MRKLLVAQHGTGECEQSCCSGQKWRLKRIKKSRRRRWITTVRFTHGVEMKKIYGDPTTVINYEVCYRFPYTATHFTFYG